MVVAIAVVLLGTMGVGAEAASTVGTCPTYRSHLLKARASILRGDRQAAITALRNAQAAMADCIREGAGETALACASIDAFTDRPSASLTRGRDRPS